LGIDDQREYDEAMTENTYQTQGIMEYEF
jgi:hypothetical protein